MTKIMCPYCCNMNTLKIICYDTDKPSKSESYSHLSNYNRLRNKEAVLANNNHHYSLDIDGKVVVRRTYDRYCPECKKSFYYFSNHFLGDIRMITLIINSKLERWKYVIKLDKNNSVYSVDHNYLTVYENISITPAKKEKIINSIMNSNIMSWYSQYGENNPNCNLKWTLYTEFSDGQVLVNGGYDKYPEEFEIFIDAYRRIFKDKILFKMK